MPCPTLEDLRTGLTVFDLLETHPFTVGQRHRPQDKAALVEQVQASSDAHRELRAIGSVWSLSEVNVADDVIDTVDLCHHLSQPYPPDFHELDRNRLCETAVDDLLARFCARNPEAASGLHFIFVEAGIKIKNLLDDLKSCGLALPTMGAGGGQSLAGALSTSTHGADFTVPPLVEWIRAVHLVGPRGREWWITPQDGIFASAEVLAMPGWPADGVMVANDDAFNAVRVAVGRMGVIYSMILEVVPAYVLVEANLEHHWPAIRSELATSSIRNGLTHGIFQATLTGFDTGWFRDHVVNRIAGSLDDIGKALGWDSKLRHAIKTTQTALGVEAARLLMGSIDIYDALGISGILDRVRSQTPVDLRHLNIVVNLTRPDQCWISRRWALPESDMQAVNLDKVESDDPVFKAVIANPRSPTSILEPFANSLTEAVDWTTAGIGVVFGVSGVIRALNEFIDKTAPSIAASIAQQCGTSGETLVLMLYKLVTHRILGFRMKEPILDSVSDIIGANVGTKFVRVGLATDILNVHNDSLDHALIGESVEFSFDASGDSYLRFADSVVSLARRYGPVFGYMGIRFTPISSALIAMQRFELTAAVEVSIMQVRTETLYANFMSQLHAAAKELGGIPHWGQEVRFTPLRESADQVAALYGDGLLRWRQMLGALSIDDPDVFSTKFTRDHNLEPAEASEIFLYDALSAFLTALDAASD